MSENKIAEGKRILTSILRQVVIKSDIPLEDVSWQWGQGDFEVAHASGIPSAGPTPYPLKVMHGGRNKVLRCTEEQLVYLAGAGTPSSPAYQETQRRLTELLRSLTSVDNV